MTKHLCCVVNLCTGDFHVKRTFIALSWSPFAENDEIRVCIKHFMVDSPPSIMTLRKRKRKINI